MSEPTLVIRYAHREVAVFSEMLIRDENGVYRTRNLSCFLRVIDELESAKRELKSALVNDEVIYLGMKYGDRAGGLAKGIALNFDRTIQMLGYVWPIDAFELAEGRTKGVYPTPEKPTAALIKSISFALIALIDALQKARTTSDQHARALEKGIGAVEKIERRFWDRSQQAFTKTCLYSGELPTLQLTSKNGQWHLTSKEQ